MTTARYIGIDVAKATLAVSTPTAGVCTVANDRAGHRELLKHLARAPVALVVLEATGRYGQEVTAALLAAGHAVAVVQAGRVRHFARSVGVLAKTDPIDAQVIARFAEATKPRHYQPAAPAVAQLRALVDRRDQVVELRKTEENHLEACTNPGICRELRTSIARLRRSEETYTRQIAALLAADSDLERKSTALQNESGVGLHTAATLLAHFPELGTLNRKQAGALSGLAPYDQASGTWQGKRAIAGGRKRLRRALYLAALSAVRWNEWLKQTYQHLRERGKAPKVALIACARKLVIRLNTILAAVSDNTQPLRITQENHP